MFHVEHYSGWIRGSTGYLILDYHDVIPTLIFGCRFSLLPRTQIEWITFSGDKDPLVTFADSYFLASVCCPYGTPCDSKIIA
jgi:hypothetical protein